MDIKIIKNLISVFENSSLSELEIDEKEGENTIKYTLKKGGEQVLIAQQPSMIMQPSTHMPVAGKPVVTEKNEGLVDFNLLSDFKSPMVGVFYQSASPEDEAFVKKGSKVKKGDTLCIIEAMKLMNEVVAEEDGEIVEVVAKNGELVEFGQVLFRII